MIGDRAITALTLSTVSYLSAWVDLREQPIDYNLISPMDTPVYYRSTTGAYFVCYKPFKRKENRGNDDFIITSDIFGRGFKRVKDFESFQKHGHSDLEIAWVLDNTNICKNLFTIAENNPGMKVPFCFNISIYSNKIKNKKFRAKFMEEHEMSKDRELWEARTKL